MTSGTEVTIPPTDIYKDPPLRVRVRKLTATGWSTMLSNPNLLFGVVVIAFMLLVSLITVLPVADWIARYDPTELALIDQLEGPSSEHWFGTDNLGRDVYSRTVHGTKTSLYVGAGVATIVTIIGVTLGVVVGYNRVADNIVMRVMDGMMSFPTLILALALVAALGSSLTNVIDPVSYTHLTLPTKA